MARQFKLIRDRVHGLIELPREYVGLVDATEFQRLRRMTQLGTSSFTYPGAEHSRFQHSLGVAHIFRLMARQFERAGTSLDEEYVQVGTLAALLHDVGHGPFSHALEGVLVPGKDHEEWSQAVILAPETEINQRLRQIDPSLPAKVAKVIGHSPEYPLLVQMITSQLDCDRMDYLLRDSDCVGVEYGGFDLERLVAMMALAEGKIVIDDRGLMVVEAYLFARYHMYWQVYFHPTTRGVELLLKAVWRRAAQLHKDGALPLDDVSVAVRLAFNKGADALSLGDYLALDNYDVFVALKSWRNARDPILSDLSRRILDRRLFKPIQVSGQGEGIKLLQALARIVQDRGLDPEYYLQWDAPSNVAYDYYTVEEGEVTRAGIWLQKKDGRLLEISASSNAIRAISEKQERVVYYVPEECREAIDDKLKGKERR